MSKELYVEKNGESIFITCFSSLSFVYECEIPKNNIEKKHIESVIHSFEDHINELKLDLIMCMRMDKKINKSEIKELLLDIEETSGTVTLLIHVIHLMNDGWKVKVDY